MNQQGQVDSSIFVPKVGSTKTPSNTSAAVELDRESHQDASRCRCASGFDLAEDATKSFGKLRKFLLRSKKNHVGCHGRVQIIHTYIYIIYIYTYRCIMCMMYY